MARSNYSYAKRLKEIARQKKQEEKRLKKKTKSEGKLEGEDRVLAEAGADVSPEDRSDHEGPKAQ